jgi:serine/threonine-protein kinase
MGVEASERGLNEGTGASAMTNAPAEEASDRGSPGTVASAVGKVVKGRYALKRLIGEGGMGAVYEGEHIEIGRRLAVKLVHSGHARNPEIAARLKQEARATGTIESEHVVQVFDAGDDEELGLFIAMELLTGEDLEKTLSVQKRLAPKLAGQIAAQAARGLAKAHANGVVHRDLKPANVFLCEHEDGAVQVKLVDFGIAKLVRDATEADGSQKLTRVGRVIGTPQYMSPEQAQGLDTVDARTDVYSLGAVLYEMIVGEPPIAELATYEQTILRIVTRPAPRISEKMPNVDPKLDQLVADMMAADPGARPPDMRAVRARLAAVFQSSDGSSGAIDSAPDVVAAAGSITQTGERVVVRSSSGGSAMAPTQTAVAIDRSDAADDLVIAGLPKLPGSKALYAGAAAVAVLLAIVGIAASRSSSAGSPAGYGLVQPAPLQASVAPPAAATEGLPTTRPSTTVEPLMTASPARPTAVDPSAAPTQRRGSSANALVASSAPAPAKPAGSPKPVASAEPQAPAPSAKAAPSKPESSPARPLGGTGISQEF